MPDSGRLKALRQQALSLFDMGVQAVDPAAAVHRALNDQPVRGPALVLAVGKAANAMMRAALQHVSTTRAIVVTSYENAQPIPGAETFAAGHPRPDENGLAAGRLILDLVGSAGAEDQVLLLLSGGGSALLPCPIEGVSLADKQRTNDLMLGGGMPIEEINLVRQNLSQLKGGGLTRLAAPAQVRTLILSDVIGDDLRAIASGPTADRLGDAAAAQAALRKAGLWDQLPQPVQQALSRVSDAPQSSQAHNQLIGSNRLGLEAMARDSGGRIMNDHLIGDVADAAQRIVRDIEGASDPILLWGGETTVALTGSGKGGRNQELALRVLKHRPKVLGDWVFLSAGSDGIDGPTDAAGGLVTSAMEFNESLSQQLTNNDSYTALQSLRALLKTGATGTNVADFQIFVRGVAASSPLRATKSALPQKSEGTKTMLCQATSSAANEPEKDGFLLN